MITMPKPDKNEFGQDADVVHALRNNLRRDMGMVVIGPPPC